MSALEEDELLRSLSRAPSVVPVMPSEIDPRYTLREELGRGGFAVVHLARDAERDTDVALKLLRSPSADGILRFKREFRTLADVRHRNCARLYDLHANREVVYFTMEYVKGATPFGKGARFCLPDALDQLREGLGHLHARGVVHRDIKPSNVLIDRNGRLVLVDFGLARTAVDGATQVVGTPEYMAPEQCAGASRLTSAVDAYAVGVMLFQALAGRLPFDERGRDVMARKVSEPPPSLASVRADVPADLCTLVDGLLDRDPERRLHAWARRRGARGEVERDAFVGRGRELERLRHAVESKVPGMHVIDGPSGIGKTALLKRVLALELHATVLRSRCHPRESVPFNAFDSIVDALARRLKREPELARVLPQDTAALATLFPVLESWVPPSEKGSATTLANGMAAFAELFERWGQLERLVLAIDDLHWADDDSVRLFETLMREGGSAPVILATHRSEEHDTALHRLARESGRPITTLSLGPLTPSESVALARALGASREQAKRAAAQAAGHPLWLRELLRGDGGHSLDQLFQSRFDALDQPTQQAMQRVAVNGRPIERGLFAHEPGVYDALLASGLVRRGPDGVSPYHDRVAEVVVAGVPSEEVCELHRELGERLVETGGSVEQAAHHFDVAGDARAPDLLERAAGAASESFAHSRAADLWARRLSHARKDDADRARLLEAQGDALAQAGRPGDAFEAYSDAGRAADGEARHRLTMQAADQRVWDGDPSQAWEAYRRSLAGLGVDVADGPRGVVQMMRSTGLRYVRRRRRARPVSRRLEVRLEALWRAFGTMASARPMRSFQLLVRYLAEAANVDHPQHRFRAACGVAYLEAARSASNGWAERRQRLAEAFEPVSDSEETRLTYLMFTAAVDAYGWRNERSLNNALACWDLSVRLGKSWSFEAIAARVLVASALHALGRIPERRRFATRLELELQARRHPMIAHLWFLQRGACQLYAEGASGGVGERLLEALDVWKPGEDDPRKGWVNQARLLIASLRADDDRADLIVRAWQSDRVAAQAMGIRYVATTLRYFEGIAAVNRLSRVAADRRAERRVRAAIRLLEREEADAEVLALGLEAGLHSVHGRHEEARTRLRRMLGPAEDAGALLPLALARYELGTVDGDAEQIRKAEAFFEEAGFTTPLHAARIFLPGDFHITREP
ncbi:MAG: AAA family ATPase [Sandaracinaceae bacterium]